MNHLWLIIGRFQPFHKGHLLLVEKSLRSHNQSILLIGSSNKKDNENPYSYQLRKDIIRSETIENTLEIYPLEDYSSDVSWTNAILEHIPKNTSKVTLYCWDVENDSAVKALKQFQDSLPFELYFHEIPRSILPISATQIRTWIQDWNSGELKKYIWEKTLEKLAIL